MIFRQSIKTVITRIGILCLFAFTILLTVIQLHAKDKIKQSTSLNKSLIGTWILDGTQRNSNPSGVGARLQLYTGKHWVVTQADPTTGEVVFHHGGTYTLKGHELVKNIEYANSSTADLIKQSHKFMIKIKGDTLTQIGIGNDWNETWLRTK